ncbi:hypothetical protein Barb4_00888 [Bacteroidales bacterium Barb4]|nr:hypothetical protein Barb4_00888 [Bacteroidales bacterium Barb4]
MRLYPVKYLGMIWNLILTLKIYSQIKHKRVMVINLSSNASNVVTYVYVNAPVIPITKAIVSVKPGSETYAGAVSIAVGNWVANASNPPYAFRIPISLSSVIAQWPVGANQKVIYNVSYSDGSLIGELTVNLVGSAEYLLTPTSVTLAKLSCNLMAQKATDYIYSTKLFDPLTLPTVIPQSSGTIYNYISVIIGSWQVSTAVEGFSYRCPVTFDASAVPDYLWEPTDTVLEYIAIDPFGSFISTMTVTLAAHVAYYGRLVIAGCDNDTKLRVCASDNNGKTWREISTGLPVFEARCLYIDGYYGQIAGHALTASMPCVYDINYELTSFKGVAKTRNTATWMSVAEHVYDIYETPVFVGRNSAKAGGSLLGGIYDYEEHTFNVPGMEGYCVTFLPSGRLVCVGAFSEANNTHIVYSDDVGRI